MTAESLALTFEEAGPESAADMLAVVLDAFSRRPPLDPPADALAETVETMAAKLARHRGLVARLDGAAVGTVLIDAQGETVWLRRFAVRPDHQGEGIAQALVSAVIRRVAITDPAATHLGVIAREELPKNVRFWGRRGFREVGRQSPSITMLRPVRMREVLVPTADDMHDLGRRLASQLRAGDVVVLSGELGAGKTTLTQGIGAGLGVVGDVTSPTFVIAREHRSAGDGPGLVHVDAYRLGGAPEFDDLDLETDLDSAVAVVEWGEGIAEGLADSHLDIRLVRTLADDGDETRLVEVSAYGERWDYTAFKNLAEVLP